MSETVPCVECGAETPREEMFGPTDSLRCPACAQRIRDRMTPGIVRKRVREYPAAVTGLLIGASVLATLIAKYGVGLDPKTLEWMGPQAYYANGEVWRHLTSTLLHGGPIHLLFNCYWIWYFGRTIEGWWGPHGMLLLWVGLGAASSAVQSVFGGPGIGLSGVLYGLFGLAFVLRKTKDWAAEVAQPQVNQVLIGWFVLCLFIGQIWNIGNWAHGAGLAAGAMLGAAVGSRYRLALVPGAFLLMIALGVLTIWVRPLWR